MVSTILTNLKGCQEWVLAGRLRTTDLRVTRHQQRYSLLTRRIARGNIPALILRASAGSCRLTAMPVLLSCMPQVLLRKPRAGPTPTASFTMSRKTRIRHLPARRYNVLRPCMPSRARLEGNRPTNEKPYDKVGPVRYWCNVSDP